MTTRYFVLTIGIFFVLLGLLGLVPNLVSLPIGAPVLTVDAGYGYLFGLFPVNLLHNLVHLTVGVLGILAYRSVGSAQLFTRGLTIFFAVLAVLGLIPSMDTTFGFIPLFGNEVWLHGLTALVSAYFGYATPRTRDIGPRAV